MAKKNELDESLLELDESKPKKDGPVTRARTKSFLDELIRLCLSWILRRAAWVKHSEWTEQGGNMENVYGEFVVFVRKMDQKEDKEEMT